MECNVAEASLQMPVAGRALLPRRLSKAVYWVIVI
jgi:hypothetical protein